MTSAKVSSPTSKLRLAYIIGTYPSLTTTFIDREISFLRQWGMDLNVVSIRRPWSKLSPEQNKLQRGVIYLLPVAVISFIIGHLKFALLRPRAYFGTFGYLLTRQHPTLKSRLMTLLHFLEGVYAARLLQEYECNQIHAHFVDRAATVALVASRLLGITYSVTAHANDIYVNPVLLPEKLAKARLVVTCTGYNREHLARVGKGTLNHKLHCIYHGLDVNHYEPGHDISQDKPLVLSVGQLKEKKGFTYLIKACRMLKDRGYNLVCQIVGEGPLRAELQAQIRELSLEDTVVLCGALPHQEVIEKYRDATLFVLPCITSANGDRDGIPNVILEAMAMQLPVVSTEHSGIPEVIQDGVNGLLVPTAHQAALTNALATLLDAPERRNQLGAQARQTIIEKFSVERNVMRLVTEFTNGSRADVGILE